MYQANEHSGPVVYSTNQQRTPLPARQTMSIKIIAYGSAAIILFLFLIISAADLMLARGHYQDDKGGTAQTLGESARAIEAQLAVFNQIIQHVARQPATKAILISRDKSGSSAWAKKMRQFLPQATGFALLTPDDKVLGESPGQSLTPQCLTDMTKINHQEHVMMPAVHQEISGTTHFDITAPVLDDADNKIGMLIASIDANNLNSLLKIKLDNGEQFTLLDGYGNTITQKGNIKDVSKSSQGEISLTGTSWKLRLRDTGSGSIVNFLSLAIFNISAILLTVGVIAYLIRFIMRSMDRDFDQVKTLLSDLASEEPLADTLPTPLLRETAEVFPAITQINRVMEKKQQLLEHQELSDKLTGLSNRRQFNLEFARAYDFARRGTPVCVVLLSLTGLDKLTNNQVSQAVKILAKTLQEFSRRVDHAARLDTNHFALLMFGASPEGTAPCLERIGRSFYKHQGEHPAIPNDSNCTLNIGYTRIHAHRDGNAAEVLKRAEEALAEAEQSANQHTANL